MKIGLLSTQYNQGFNQSFKATVKYDESVDKFEKDVDNPNSKLSKESQKNYLLRLGIKRANRVIDYVKSSIEPQAKKELPDDGVFTVKIRESGRDWNNGFSVTLNYQEGTSKPERWADIDTCSQCYYGLPSFKSGYLSALSHKTGKKFEYDGQECMHDYENDYADREECDK